MKTILIEFSRLIYINIHFILVSYNLKQFSALIDTIQLVQSLRSFLPPPHIAVSSWKNEDKHG